MPKTTAWHSTRPEVKVYHNNTKCTEGNNIEAKYRKEGTGNKDRLCDTCAKLNADGK